ncbi:MAG TPA: hypothetical protein VNT02_09710 [Burkholderiales bacterium]|nr:hypothetical protein [Burkholderiales bacterium]
MSPRFLHAGAAEIARRPVSMVRRGAAPGTVLAPAPVSRHAYGGADMNSIIYIIGLIVVILAILSFFGMR